MLVNTPWGFGKGTAKVVSFPTGTSYWTAPSGINLLTTVSGYGASGSGTYSGLLVTLSVSIGYDPQGTGGNTGLTTDIVVNTGSAIYNGFSVGSYGPANSVISEQFILNGLDSSWYTTQTGGSFSGYYITGASVNNSIPRGVSLTSSNISSYAGLANYGYIYAAMGGGAGAASTAFGKSFPGGGTSGAYPSITGLPASLTTFANVPVTPGTKYTIVNNSSNPLIITYYA